MISNCLMTLKYITLKYALDSHIQLCTTKLFITRDSKKGAFLPIFYKYKCFRTSLEDHWALSQVWMFPLHYIFGVQIFANFKRGTCTFIFFRKVPKSTYKHILAPCALGSGNFFWGAGGIALFLSELLLLALVWFWLFFLIAYYNSLNLPPSSTTMIGSSNSIVNSLLFSSCCQEKYDYPTKHVKRSIRINNVKVLSRFFLFNLIARALLLGMKLFACLTWRDSLWASHMGWGKSFGYTFLWNIASNDRIIFRRPLFVELWFRRKILMGSPFCFQTR